MYLNCSWYKYIFFEFNHTLVMYKDHVKICGLKKRKTLSGSVCCGYQTTCPTYRKGCICLCKQTDANLL